VDKPCLIKGSVRAGTQRPKRTWRIAVIAKWRAVNPPCDWSPCLRQSIAKGVGRPAGFAFTDAARMDGRSLPPGSDAAQAFVAVSRVRPANDPGRPPCAPSRRKAAEMMRRVGDPNQLFEVIGGAPLLLRRER